VPSPSSELPSRWHHVFFGAGGGQHGRHRRLPHESFESRWSRLSASLRLGTDGYSYGLIWLLCPSKQLQSFGATDVSLDATDFVSSFHHGMASSAIWVLLLGVIILLFDVRRILPAGPAE
jgi:hypothetical protein